MKINVRPLVKELLEDENLIVNYNELNNGGFDLSVRINEEALNTGKIMDEHLIKSKEIKTESAFHPIATCPHCGSKNVQFMYGTGLSSTNKNEFSCHYLCRECLEEFDVV